MQRDSLFHEPLNSYLNELLDLYEACEVEELEEEDVTTATPAPAECSVIETTATEVAASTTADFEQTTPGARRNARRDARRKQAAAKVTVLPNTDLNETTSP